MTDNELIALFMGYEFENRAVYSYIDDPNPRRKNVYTIGVKMYPSDKLKFHSSFDWLMPVVKKLRDDSFFASLPQDGMAYVLEIAIDEALLKVDIEETYIAVVEFIKWYNNSLI